jgi:hydroxysqualene synthase
MADPLSPAVTPSKTHRGENFPVASHLIAAAHRPAILAYYRFARGADDVADSEKLTPDQKLAGLDRFEHTLLGRTDAEPAALPLRAILAERRLPARHALDLLQAFRMDAVQNRYPDFDALLNYCLYSAAPVGRFVLTVHGESEATWPASDALCTALQIINHLQDCGADYRRLDRVYVPLDMLNATGARVEELGATRASPALRRTLTAVADRTSALVTAGAGLPPLVRDARLCLETAIIARLARRLTDGLLRADPLADRVHLGKVGAAFWAVRGLMDGAKLRLRRPAPTALAREA